MNVKGGGQAVITQYFCRGRGVGPWLRMITEGMRGWKKFQKIDYVICKWPLINIMIFLNWSLYSVYINMLARFVLHMF